MYEGMCFSAFNNLHQDLTVSLPPRKFCTFWMLQFAGVFHFRAHCFLQILDAPADFTILELLTKCEHTPHTWALCFIMEIEKILHEIGKTYSPLCEECQNELIRNSSLKRFKKGDVVVREGQHSKKAYLIIEGCARAYYLKDGKDISDWFTFENQFMASIISFFSNQPSPHYVEFMEESTVLEFSKETLDLLSNRYHDFERFISKVVTETMLGLCERLHTIQFSKADERYQNLIAIYPYITQRMPLTHIASYLGITLETLSRIRNPKVRI